MSCACPSCTEVIPVTPEIEKVVFHAVKAAVNQLAGAATAQQGYPPPLARVVLAAAFRAAEALGRDGMPAEYQALVDRLAERFANESKAAQADVATSVRESLARLFGVAPAEPSKVN